MQNSLLIKALVFVVVFLFVGISILPLTGNIINSHFMGGTTI